MRLLTEREARDLAKYIFVYKKYHFDYSPKEIFDLIESWLSKKEMDYKIKNIETQIEDYLIRHLDLKFGDKVQLLDNYIYIEFDDKQDKEYKLRIPYSKNKTDFIENFDAGADTWPFYMPYILIQIIKGMLEK